MPFFWYYLVSRILIIFGGFLWHATFHMRNIFFQRLWQGAFGSIGSTSYNFGVQAIRETTFRETIVFFSPECKDSLFFRFNVMCNRTCRRNSILFHIQTYGYRIYSQFFTALRKWWILHSMICDFMCLFPFYCPFNCFLWYALSIPNICFNGSFVYIIKFTTSLNAGPFSISEYDLFTFFQFNKMCNRFFSSTFILILIRHYTTVTYSIKVTAFMLTFKSSAIVHKFEFLHVIWSDFTWHKNFFPPFIVIGSDTC